MSGLARHDVLFDNHQRRPVDGQPPFERLVEEPEEPAGRPPNGAVCPAEARAPVPRLVARACSASP